MKFHRPGTQYPEIPDFAGANPKPERTLTNFVGGVVAMCGLATWTLMFLRMFS